MDPPPLPRWNSSNVAFAGTHATKGYGVSVAIECGKNTEIGKMLELSFQERPVRRVTNHIKQIRFYTICLAIIWLFVALYLISNVSFIGLETYITLMIALTPIYMPFLLFWGMKSTRDSMLDDHCYARSLEATSTVGLTTVIVTDMSRTLTHRWMRVTEIFVEMELVSADKANEETLGPRFTELIQASVLCNDAIINSGNMGVPRAKKTIYGNFLDIAMLRYGLFNLQDINQLRRDHEKVANKAYNSLDRVQVTVHRTYGPNRHPKLLLLMKGHCDTVIRRCSTFAVGDEEVPLDEELQDTIIKLTEGLLAAGRHVRAFAYKELTNRLEMRRISQNYSGGGGGEFRDYLAVDTFSLRFLGLIATYTPSRSTIPNAVARCRTAGIKLVLATDHDANRAWAMASEIGLLLPHLDEVESGAHFRNYKTVELVDMSEYTEEKDHHQQWYIQQMLINQRDLLCAKTTPQQVKWIVEACQQMGAVVSVIGGSVHDTPALTSASVGVCRLGCAAICEYSADLILLDGSFATLSRAIADSRRLFENLKKALVYCLAPNTVWLVSYLAFFALGIPLLIDVIDILIVSVFVNLLPSLALLYEYPEERLMLQKPKVYDDCLLNIRLLFVSHILLGTIQASAFFTSYIMFMMDRGFPPSILLHVNIVWNDESVNDLTDSHGQEWSSAERRQLDCQVSTLCLLAIIVMQCTNLVLNKTGRANLLVHGFNNKRLAAAVVYLIVLCVVLLWLDTACCLYLKDAQKLSFGAFFYVIFPFVPLTIFLESARKYFLRLFPHSWLERATMY